MLTLRWIRVSSSILPDRGVRCRRGGWIGLMDGHGLARSMPRKACSPDNAADEEFSGPLKVEMHHGAGWERRAAAELEAELAEHMDRYNRERIEVSLSEYVLSAV